MKKLIELLNEYEKEKEKSEGLSMYTWEILTGCLIARSNYSDNLLDISEPLIYGKSYGFIKWLIDNDKIGRNKNSDRSAMIDLMRAVVKEQTEVFEGIERYEWYIMILSIQDNPIQFLCEILK